MLRRAAGSAAILTASGSAALWLYLREVSPCEPPPNSALQYIVTSSNAWYSDCFNIRVPTAALRKQSAPRRLDAFCKAFFRCPPMQLERAMLGLAGLRTTSDAVIECLEFVERDEIGEFRVLARGQADILFEAGAGSSVYSWLGVHFRDDHVDLMFGSAMVGGGYKGVPLHEYLAMQVAMPFHFVYSRVLLKEAARLLQHEAAATAS